MTYNTVKADGLVIRTAWDEHYVGPVELLITIDHSLWPVGKGIAEKALKRLSLQSMCPEEMKALGSLRVVGDWLEANKPRLRSRPEDPNLFFAHVALFFVLAVQSGEKGVINILANYAAVKTSMARQWIDTARRRGMLTDNRERNFTGRACGVLTDKARAILATQSASQEDQVAA